MVAFALLRRDHFSPSPAGARFVDPDFIQRSSPHPSPNLRATAALDREPEGKASGEQQNVQHPTVSSPGCQPVPEKGSDGSDSYFVPPSPGHADGSYLSYLPSSPMSRVRKAPIRKGVTSMVGRQRGFWQHSSFAEGGSGRTGLFSSGTLARIRLDETDTSGGAGRSMSYWDRCSGMPCVWPEGDACYEVVLADVAGGTGRSLYFDDTPKI